MGRRTATAALALVAVALTCAMVSGCDFDGAAESEEGAAAAIEGVFPEFDPAVKRYVSRCGRGAPPISVETAQGRVERSASPGADFPITVVDGGQREVYRVRCLPADFPQWRFEQMRPVGPGLFVVSFRIPGDRPWVIIFDHAGVPRWWFNPKTPALWAQVLRDGSVSWARSFQDGYGLDPQMAHEVRSLSGGLKRVVRTKGSIIDGHEFRELANGNVLLDTYAPGGGLDLRPFGGPRNASAVFAEVQEIDENGRVVWRWNSRRHIALNETGRWWRNVLSNPKRGRAGRKLFDPVHINSIDPRGPHEVVVSTRHTDAIYGIDRKTGHITWKLGGLQTPASLRIIGDPATKTFGGQHDARVDRDGILSVLDNGKDRPRLPRVVFFRIDEEQGTATYLSQLNDPRVTTSHCCGSARPLGGGAWLVSWGDNRIVSAFDEEEQIAFRYTLAASAFRAVPVPRGAVTEAELDRSLESME